MLPGIPKGGLLTVSEMGAALVPPILVSRSLRLRLVFSATLPKLKDVLLSYLTHPPLGDPNSTKTFGVSEPEPSTLKIFEPPVELTWTNTA
jgi:hypothetical protein